MLQGLADCDSLVRVVDQHQLKNVNALLGDLGQQFVQACAILITRGILSAGS